MDGFGRISHAEEPRKRRTFMALEDERRVLDLFRTPTRHEPTKNPSLLEQAYSGGEGHSLKSYESEFIGGSG